MNENKTENETNKATSYINVALIWMMYDVVKNHVVRFNITTDGITICLPITNCETLANILSAIDEITVTNKDFTISFSYPKIMINVLPLQVELLVLDEEMFFITYPFKLTKREISLCEILNFDNH